MFARALAATAAAFVSSIAAIATANAADQPAVPRPALYEAVAAKATGGVCPGALSLSDLAALQRYIDRFLAVDKEVSQGRPSENIAPVVVAELHETYTRLRRAPGGCGEKQIGEAREQLRRIAYHVERPDYWHGVRNPAPWAGNAIHARVIGKKCDGIFDVDQMKTLDRFIAAKREELAKTANSADMAVYDKLLADAERDMSAGWWFPWHCTRAVQSEARRTLKQIEAIAAKRTGTGE